MTFVILPWIRLCNINTIERAALPSAGFDRVFRLRAELELVVRFSKRMHPLPVPAAALPLDFSVP